MRIVDRATFMAMPAGTIFAKWNAQPADGSHIDLGYEEVAIKGDTVAGVDFVVQDLMPWPLGTHDSERWVDTMEAALGGDETAVLDYDWCGRDGEFEDDQLFAVWSQADAVALVERMKRALLEGYGVRS